MATYLYCVLTPPKPDALAARLTGIGDVPVRSLVCPDGAGIEGWVSTIDNAALRVRGDALASQVLQHNAVVDAALATGRTPAPARFGSRFEDDATCVADLERHRSILTRILDRVAGAVEMSVLLVPNGDIAGAPSPHSMPDRNAPAAGRRYLELLRERQRQTDQRRQTAEVEANRIGSSVQNLVRGESRSWSAAGGMSVAHLVARENVEAYRRTLGSIQAGPGYRHVLAGPRAPYSFAGQPDDLSGHDSSNLNRNE
jgi:hypothetical protein